MMAMLKDAGQINTCSRVVPLETFIDRQDYNSGALYVVKNTP
jgi:hypothetical protein